MLVEIWDFSKIKLFILFFYAVLRCFDAWKAKLPRKWGLYHDENVTRDF